MKVVLAVTGSVAATLTPNLIAELKKRGHDVCVIATEKSLYFWDHTEALATVYRDSHEWSEYRYERGDSVLHIEIRNWGDVLLIAPLSANTLAKIANGMADNLVTSVVRAWDMAKPIVVAPAMNTHMWNHPVTAEQLNKVKTWNSGLKVIEPVVKILACGEEGVGAMAPIEKIAESLGG